MLKFFISLSVSVGLLACTPSVTQAETFSCEGDKDTVGHFMEVTAQDGMVSKFDYFSSTPVYGAVNNCSVDSGGAKVSLLSDGVQSFALPDDDTVIVSKKDQQFVFDFSKLSVSHFCGSSSTIAKHLTITPGVKRCSDIDNFR